MSAAELLLVSTRPRARVSTRFLRSELKIIFGRRRNIAGLAVLAVVPVILAISAGFLAREARSPTSCTLSGMVTGILTFSLNSCLIVLDTS